MTSNGMMTTTDPVQQARQDARDDFMGRLRDAFPPESDERMICERKADQWWPGTEERG